MRVILNNRDVRTIGVRDIFRLKYPMCCKCDQVTTSRFIHGRGGCYCV